MKEEMERKLILLAEDDPDDIYLISEAIDESKLPVNMMMVQDGEELLQYLYHKPPYEDPKISPRPDLILLDLNMPRVDGREVLEEIKSDPALRMIPIIVLTTSKAEEDLERTYTAGASGFVTKPASFRGLREAIAKIGAYWLGTVGLPEE
jgi:CheY-like chemotaxis protein